MFSLASTFPAGEVPDEDPPRGDQPVTPSIQTVNGPNIILNQSGVYFAESSLSSGGSAMTASNSVMVLSPAGTLVIGSSKIALSLADTRGTSPTKLNIDA